ncbi:MAG: hypothetical protein V4691_06995 [Pseudomonadota bacterium]
MAHARFYLKLAVLAALVFFACSLSSLSAQEAVGEEKVQQVQLNADTVKRFITAFEDIKRWQKANDVTASTKGGEEEEEAGENLLSPVQGAANSEQMQTMLKKHGFDNLDVWGQTAQSVMLAYGYADPEGGLVDLDSNIQKSIEQIKNDADLSEEEKKEAVQNLENEYKSVAEMKPLPGNIDVVKPFVPQIKKMTESE